MPLRELKQLRTRGRRIMKRRNNHEIREFWRSPSRNKDGPFSRFLIRNINRVIYLQPFFRGKAPDFFDTEGNLHPLAHNDCLRMIKARETKDL